MSRHSQVQVTTAHGTNRTKQRRRRPRWGMVMCPDGPRSVNLDVMRIAMTRSMVAGELSDKPVDDLARKAGTSRSTMSRILNGRGASLRTLLAVLAVLRLTFEDVVSDAVTSAEGLSDP